MRCFSMSAGLAASTVTPGSTAPDASLTTPAIDAATFCADAASGTIISTPTIRTHRTDRYMAAPLGPRCVTEGDAGIQKLQRRVKDAAVVRAIQQWLNDRALSTAPDSNPTSVAKRRLPSGACGFTRASALIHL